MVRGFNEMAINYLTNRQKTDTMNANGILLFLFRASVLFPASAVVACPPMFMAVGASFDRLLRE